MPSRIHTKAACLALALLWLPLAGCNQSEPEPVVTGPVFTPTPRPNLEIPITITDAADINFVFDNLSYYLPSLPLRQEFRDDLRTAKVADLNRAMTTYQGFTIAYLSGNYEEATQSLASIKAPNAFAVKRSRMNLVMLQKYYEEAEKLQLDLEIADADAKAVRQFGVLLNLRRGAYEEALSVLTELADDHLKDQAVWTLLGVAHLALGDSRKANSALQTGLRLFPNNHVVWYHIGTAALLGENYHDAHKAYVKANQLREDAPRLMMRLAKSQLRLNKLDEGIATLQRYIEQRKTEKAGYLVLADVYRYQREISKADEQYVSILRYYPQDRQTGLLLAQMLMDNDKYTRAITVLERFLEYYPSDFDILKDLAHSSYQADRFDDAIRFYGQAFRINDQDPDAWIEYGQAYAEVNRKRDALRAYNKAKELLGQSARTKDKVRTVNDLIALVSTPEQ